MAKNVYIGAENFPKINLPSEYTQLEYIQSSGTQYIDTGVSISPTNAANIKYEIVTQITLGTNYNINGTGNGASPYFNSMYLGFDPSGYPVYGDGQVDQTFSTSQKYGGEKVTITYDAPNKILNISGYISNQAFTFQSPTSAINFLLFGYGRGTENKLHTAKIYSAKIWQSGTLIRDFVPCKNSSGTLGLYDLANNIFYSNAGSGTFTAGTVYTVNVARMVKDIYIGVDPVTREVKSGYKGVDGVARQFWKKGGKLGELSVGETVYMNINGVSKEFIVVQQGVPSSAYDSSCDGTWLLMEDCYTNRVWDSTNHDYANSDIHSYLNGTFLSLLDADIKSAVKTAKVPYRKGSGSSYTVQSGANGLSAKVFLLSYTEVGCSGSGFAATEGAVIDYFNGAPYTDRIAYINGSAVKWWLRSPKVQYTDSALSIAANGGDGSDVVTNSCAVRPCLILPSDAMVDGEYNIIPPELEVIPIGNLDVGEIVYLNVNGVSTEFIVVQQGSPSSDYVNADGTWLLMKDCYTKMVWDGDSNDWSSSDIRTYLESTFKNLLDSNIKNQLKIANIPFTSNGSVIGGNIQTAGQGSSVFLLSMSEVGATITSNTGCNVEGAALDYFEGAANSKRIAYYNGTAANWFTRSPSTYNSYNIYAVLNNGTTFSDIYTDYSHGIRPCLILPSTLGVDGSYNVVP